jgi:predicted Zn-dependent protease
VHREGAPRLPFARARSGLRSGIARADRARDAGQFTLAARYYRQALREDPELPAIWVQYGHMLLETGDAAGAEAAYRESLRRDPENPDTHLQLGRALNLQGRAEAAEAAYRRAAALDRPQDLADQAISGNRGS